MDRREYLGLVAGGATLSELSEISVGAEIPDTTGSSRSYPPDGIEAVDWYPHYEIDIPKSGRAVATLTAKGSEIPENLILYDRDVTDEKILAGDSGLTNHDQGYRWEPSESNPIEYSVELGHYGKSGYFNTAVLDDAVVSIVHEYLAAGDWTGGLQALPKTHRLTVNPPDGWISAVPGIQVESNTYDLYPNVNPAGRPRDAFVVGDLDVMTRSVGDSEIRFLELPSADGPDREELLDTLAGAHPILANYYNFEKIEPVLAVVAPQNVSGSGATFRGDMIGLEDKYTQETMRNAKTSFLSELTHTFERFNEPEWQYEGQTTWFMMLLLYDMGEITDAGLRDIIDEDVQREEQISVPAADSVYVKSRLVVGAIDTDIRARTNGEADISDFLERTNDQRFVPHNRVSRHEQLAALYDIIGVDYIDFYQRYVDGTEYPEELVSDDFSISDPEPIDFAAFEYETTVSATDPPIGEVWSLEVEVINGGGSAGSRSLEFVIDGEVIRSTGVELQPDESTRISFEHEFNRGGERTIRVDPAFQRTLNVRGALRITDISVSTREVLPGETVLLTADVANTADKAREVPVAVTGTNDEGVQTLHSTSVDLGADESSSLTLEFVFKGAGEYDLAINGRDAGNVRVDRPDRPFTFRGELSAEEIRVGETVTVKLQAIFHGPGSGTLRFVVQANNQTLTRESFEVEGYTTKEMSIAHAFREPGEYDLTVGAQREKFDIGTVMVAPEKTPTPTPTPTVQPTPSPIPTKSTTPTESTAETPGFGVMSALAGMGSTIGYLLYRSDSDDQ